MKTLFARTFPTPIVPMFAAVDEAGALVRLDFLVGRSAANLMASLGRRGVQVVNDATAAANVVAQVGEYFSGTRTSFDLPLAPAGTDFQKLVWSELLRIGFGEAISYAELARRIGRPTAVRAVGRANATNPIALVVPCHRVIGADGTLTGYASGTDIKAKLLEHEGRAPAPAMPVRKANRVEAVAGLFD